MHPRLSGTTAPLTLTGERRDLGSAPPYHPRGYHAETGAHPAVDSEARGGPAPCGTTRTHQPAGPARSRGLPATSAPTLRREAWLIIQDRATQKLFFSKRSKRNVRPKFRRNPSLDARRRRVGAGRGAPDLPCGAARGRARGASSTPALRQVASPDMGVPGSRGAAEEGVSPSPGAGRRGMGARGSKDAAGSFVTGSLRGRGI